MPIFRNGRKSIFFLHVPKAGGSSVTSACKFYLDNSLTRWDKSLRVQRQHYTYLQCKQAFEGFDAMPKVVVVRHPLTRMLSEFSYRDDKEKNNLSLMWFAIKNTVKRCWRPNLYSNHLVPQVEFVTNGVTFWKLENQGVYKVVDAISDELGIEQLKVGWENEGRASVLNVWWCVKILIFVIYRADYKKFGYRLGPE